MEKIDLKQSDAQLVTIQGTNPTGVIRLSQAGFKVNGVLIDKNTYFRDNIFAGFNWRERTRPNNSLLQETTIRFQIIIDGNNKGEFNLRISHDSDRIANQANIPTTLHWGDAIDIIRRSNILGKTLFLYGPPEGQTEPFFIIIKDNTQGVRPISDFF